jgi:hypothetical protein
MFMDARPRGHDSGGSGVLFGSQSRIGFAVRDDILT